MSDPQSMPSPRTARSNSISSLRSESERHLRFSLARMASHEATDIPHTHHEEPEEQDEATLISPRGSANSTSTESSNSQKESRKKHIEHEAEYALEEGIEAATGTAFQSSASFTTDDGRAASGEQTGRRSSDGREAAAEGEDLEAQDGEQSGSGKGKKQRKTVELQDQTNLLPVKQVIVVFAGLSAALFCSLLDQTM
jgi:hypothetical protein